MEYLEINNIEQLRELKSITKKIKKIELKLPFLSNSENQTWEKRIRKEYFSCGCNTGSFFVNVVVIISLLYVGYCLCTSNTISIKWIGITIVVSALIGKFTGLIAAHIRMLRIIKLLTQLQQKTNEQLINT